MDALCQPVSIYFLFLLLLSFTVPISPSLRWRNITSFHPRSEQSLGLKVKCDTFSAALDLFLVLTNFYLLRDRFWCFRSKGILTLFKIPVWSQNTDEKTSKKKTSHEI